MKWELVSNIKVLEIVTLLTVVSRGTCSYSTYLNVAIVGYTGRTNFENYAAVRNKLEEEDPLPFCKLNLTEISYDKRDGSHLYNSLTYARSLFSVKEMGIAVGPYIDVFTSMQYVIQHQVHLVTGSIEKSEPSDRTFPVLPDATSMSVAIANIVKTLDWKKVAFLSQDDFAPVLSLSQQGIFVLPIQLPVKMTGKDDSELRHTLTTLRKAHMEKFVIHSMNRDVVKNVIHAAEDLHLLHHSRKWFVTYLDFEDVFEQKEFASSAMVFGLQLLDPSKLTVGLKGKYFEERSRFEVATLVDTVSMLRHLLSNNIDCNAEPEQNKFIEAKHVLDKMKQHDNQFIGALGAYRWASSTGIRKQGHIKTDFNLTITRLNGAVESVGHCTFKGTEPHVEINPELTKEIEHSLQEVLRKKNFTVITRMDPPFVQNGPDGQIQGYCVDILKELSVMMKFDYNIRVSDNTNKWETIINELVEGNADIIMGSLDVKSSREEKISFSTTVMDSTVSILIQKPPATPTFFQFLGPFTSGLWLTILGVFFVVGGALFLMGKYDVTQRESEQRFDLKESLWYSLNVLLQGGTEYSPQTTSMRTIVAIYWFCTLIITTAYTANLAAFLTLKNIDNRIKSTDALVSQKKIQYGIHKGSDLESFFTKSDNDLYKRMWTYMKLNEDDVIFESREEARQKVFRQEPKYVYLDDSVMNDHFAMEHCKTLESIAQGFGDKQYSFGFPRGAPYRDDINRALLILKEDGYLDILKSKWWKPNCTKDEAEETLIKSSSELEIENMFGVFLILLGSVVMAIIVEATKRLRLDLEKKYHKKKVTEELKS